MSNDQQAPKPTGPQPRFGARSLFAVPISQGKGAQGLNIHPLMPSESVTIEISHITEARFFGLLSGQHKIIYQGVVQADINGEAFLRLAFSSGSYAIVVKRGRGHTEFTDFKVG